MKFSIPKILLLLEGSTVFVAACAIYAYRGDSWLSFGALFFAPDLTMLGYVFRNNVGSACYNFSHTYTVVGVFWMIAQFFHFPHAAPISLIWLAHIGLDRFLGYGLKYPSAFKDTHLGRV
jgi:hypothetical protein